MVAEVLEDLMQKIDPILIDALEHSGDLAWGFSPIPDRLIVGRVEVALEDPNPEERQILLSRIWPRPFDRAMERCGVGVVPILQQTS